MTNQLDVHRDAFGYDTSSSARNFRNLNLHSAIDYH